MAEPQINVLSAKAMLDGMNATFEQMNTLLKAYGIEMYIYKVKTYMKEAEEGKPIDDDAKDPRTVIDYIVRIKTEDPVTGMALKKALLGEKEENDKGGE